MTEIRTVTAPWTPEQVEHLIEFQTSGYMHPLTCGCPASNRTLVVTPDGLVCPNDRCTWTQTEVPGYAADGSAVARYREFWRWVDEARNRRRDT